MNSVKYIPGEGTSSPRLIIIGEAPGKEEDLLGRPFVGKAGKLLDKVFEELNLERYYDLYITNVVKVRPDENRTPTYEELNSWLFQLEKELNTINCIKIVTLGASATKAFLGEDVKITQLRGDKYSIVTSLNKRIEVFPTYHPAYVLRNQNEYDTLKLDIQRALEYK